MAFGSPTLSFFAGPPLAQPPGEEPWNRTQINFSPAQKCASPRGRPLQTVDRRGGRDPCWHTQPWPHQNQITTSEKVTTKELKSQTLELLSKKFFDA